MTCPEHGFPFPCRIAIEYHWHLADLGESPNGWYVVSPSAQTWGPYSEEEGAALLKKLQGAELS